MSEFAALLISFTAGRITSDNWKRAVIEWLYREQKQSGVAR